MQGIEVMELPQALQPPLAELVGLQFGLATASELLGHSVLGNKIKETLKSVVDPRLGLPAEDGKCATCGGSTSDECTGHFAHLKLTQPIYHPNHMRLLQRLLHRICLACGVPKVKKKNSAAEEMLADSKQRARVKDSGLFNGERELPVLLEADPIEKSADGQLIVLSSDDEEFPRDILRVVQPGPMDFSIGSTSGSGMSHLQNLKGHWRKGKVHANGSSHVEVTSNRTMKTATMKSCPAQSPQKFLKGTPAGVDVLHVHTSETPLPSKTSTCPHCLPNNSDYPPIVLKILPVKGKKKDDVSQILQMEVDVKKDGNQDYDFALPRNFWAFVDGPAETREDVPYKRVLHPSEALSILKKIPEGEIAKLGMNSSVARPEALIWKCVPIPPNCTRTTDYKYVNNTTAVRFGTDKVTRTLQNLISEIERIQGTRAGKATQRARKDESNVLQIRTTEYLREKGAPKAVPGKEPLKKDRNGRITKQDDHRWSKDWLTQNILGKGGNYCARAVIAGDPSLDIEEIGVPWEIAKQLTIPERSTKWNRTKLQEYVNRTQTLQGSGKPGATRIERHGEAFQVWTNSTHKVQIGDVVHRNILDGDYIYVNRPPSVHKHSLMALRVFLHKGLVLTVNPLVCPPFNADFDGDIFHVFVPQSLQAVAELKDLMSVQQQIISDHGGQPLLGLTQDTLLAAYLMTSSKLLVEKRTMDQLSIWSSRQPPEAAITMSPKGGPFWTGEQVFELTLPAEFNLGSSDEGVFVKGGVILKWSENAKLLRKDKESLTAAIGIQLGPQALVDYLNSATGLLHAWLQMQGFSTGLSDFLVTNSLASRQKMLQTIFEDYYVKSIQESCDSIRILDAQSQALGPDMVINPESLSKKVRFLEQAAQAIFRTRAADAENIVWRYAEKENSLLLMVKSGSKGSMTKLLQQIAGMGLQLYKGKHLLPFSGIRRPLMSNSPVIDWWEDKGLVQSSLVDGLNASELFNHVIADRTGILRKHVEVQQPGTLFKSLMLFMRDLYIVYDGSVRSQCGQNLVQFCYGGAIGVPKRLGSNSGSIWDQFGMEDPSTPCEEARDQVTWEEDEHKRWSLSVLAGEPVGVLAATAVAQPAYESMLDAPNLNGPFNPKPLELVQETLYPRDKSDLKPSDRSVIIRLVHCQCTKPQCLERRVLAVQAHLKRVTLRMVAQSSAIEFWNMDDFGIAGANGVALRLGSPWLGHIELSLDMMHQNQVNIEDIVQRLREKFKKRINKRDQIGEIFFCHRENCHITKGLCLHFSPKLPPLMQNQRSNEKYNEALLKLLVKIRSIMIPGILNSTVKGDERLESVRIVSEGPTWTTWHSGSAYNGESDEELVLEILVSSQGKKAQRGMAWTAVKQACLPLMDMVDWNRSMPYSIQEIKRALGVEVAYQMIIRRLALVLEKTAPHTHPVHVKLLADMMTFSGDANGFTFSGYQDMNKTTRVSAPFTEASFQKPIRNFLDAGGRGACDPLEGVMTNCVWGKEAPLGTGTNFDIFWQPPKDPQGEVATWSEAERDVHVIWNDLDGKCIPDKPIPPSPTRSLPDLHKLLGDMDLDDGAGFSPQHAPNGNTGDNPDADWGSSHQNEGENDGAWGAKASAGNGHGGDCGAWDVKASDGSGHGDWDWDESADRARSNNVDKPAQGSGGWDASSKENCNSDDAWGNGGQGEGAGGWGGTPAETRDGGAWDVFDGSYEDRSRPDGDANNGAGERGKRSIHSGEASSKNVGGWKTSNHTNTVGTGWDNIGTVPDQGGWESLSTDAAGLECPFPVHTREGAQTENRPSYIEDTNCRQDSNPEKTISQERNLTSRDEDEREEERSWSSRGRGRDRDSRGSVRDRVGTGSLPGSGANLIPLGRQRRFGKVQPNANTESDTFVPHSSRVHEQNAGERNAWGSSQYLPQDASGPSSGWDDLTTSRNTPTGPSSSLDDFKTSSNTPTDRDGNWIQAVSDKTDALQQSSAQDEQCTATVLGDEWGQLISGTTKLGEWAKDPWASFASSQNDDLAADGWESVIPEDRGNGIRARGISSSVGGMPRTSRQHEIQPEFKEIHDNVKSMRGILFNTANELGARLSDEDDEAVQAVLAYHPKYPEKAGCGVAYIKVDKSPGFENNRCFWLVRTDGSETDFSFHKCLKEKVSREYPSFADKYELLYGGRRSRAPAPSLAEEERPATLREDTATESGQELLPPLTVEAN